MYKLQLAVLMRKLQFETWMCWCANHKKHRWEYVQLCSHANARLGLNSWDNVQITGCGADVQIVSKGAGAAGEKGCRCAVMPVQVQAGCDCQARPHQTEVQASSAGTTWSPRRSAPPVSYQERLWQCGAATKSDRERGFYSRGKLLSPLIWAVTD